MATKLGKYSSAGFVDSTLTKPKRQDTSSGYVSVEETLNAMAKANKIRKAVTGSLGSILAVVLLGYIVIAGTVGMFTFNAGGAHFVLRPAFSNGAITGGYIQKQGEIVYASTTNTADTDFLSQVITAFSGGAPQGIIGKAVAIDYSGIIDIKDDGTIEIKDGDKTAAVEGTYNGSLRGEQKLTDQYIIQCIAGECEEGELLIISKDNIHGVVK